MSDPELNDLETACHNIAERMTEHSYKTHNCGNNAIAMYSEEEWKLLPFVGIGPAEDDDKILEYRNCTCGSTLAVEHPRSSVEPTISQHVEVPAPESSLTRLLSDK